MSHNPNLRESLARAVALGVSITFLKNRSEYKLVHEPSRHRVVCSSRRKDTPRSVLVMLAHVEKWIADHPTEAPAEQPAPAPGKAANGQPSRLFRVLTAATAEKPAAPVVHRQHHPGPPRVEHPTPDGGAIVSFHGATETRPQWMKDAERDLAAQPKPDPPAPAAAAEPKGEPMRAAEPVKTGRARVVYRPKPELGAAVVQWFERVELVWAHSRSPRCYAAIEAKTPDLLIDLNGHKLPEDWFTRYTRLALADERARRGTARPAPAIVPPVDPRLLTSARSVELGGHISERVWRLVSGGDVATLEAILELLDG